MSKLFRLVAVAVALILSTAVATAVDWPTGPPGGEDHLPLVKLQANDDPAPPPIELPPPGDGEEIEMGKNDTLNPRLVGGSLLSPGGGAISSQKDTIERSLRRLTKKLR